MRQTWILGLAALAITCCFFVGPVDAKPQNDQEPQKLSLNATPADVEHHFDAEAWLKLSQTEAMASLPSLVPIHPLNPLQTTVLDASQRAGQLTLSHDDLASLQTSKDEIDRWRNWKPDEPFDLTGDPPAPEVVRAAIKQGVDFLLSEQLENGAWDVNVQEDGKILSGTADDAVDAVTATSMAGIALRSHIAFDPDRIEPALRKGAEFVMDRVIRGKLSKIVLYAIWRYSFGVRFLMGEWRNARDEEYKERLYGVCRRMVSAILAMQNSNDERGKLERRRNARVSSRSGNHGATTGIVVALPTDQDYRGGARIVKILDWCDTRGALEVGDRIVKMQNVPVENAYDFYELEADLVEGSNGITLSVKKANGADASSNPINVRLNIPVLRPGTIGIHAESSGDGAIIRGFNPASPAAEAGLEVGDVIIEMDRADITTLDSFTAADQSLKVGGRVRLSYMRGGKKKSLSLNASKRADGFPGFFPNDEDKGDESGIELLNVVPARSYWGIAARAGLQQGDRITKINDYEILGVDHYMTLSGTFFAGQKLTLSVVRMVPEDPKVEEAPAEGAAKEGAAKEGEAAGEKPAEEKAGEEKPADEKPAEEKPAEDKPAGEKAADEKPAGEEPAGEKPAGEGEDPGIGGPPPEEKAPEITYKREEFQVELVLLPNANRGTLQASGQNAPRNSGVLITDVEKKGVADKAGLKKNDLVTAVDGVRIPNMQQLSRFMQNKYEGEKVELTIKRSSREMTVTVTLAPHPGLVYTEVGGWAYYKNPQAPSFVTSAVLLNLEEIGETFSNLRIPRDTLKPGVQALADLRVPDPTDPKKMSYVYDERGINAPMWRDIRGNVGRIMVGELALETYGQITKAQLGRSLDVWVQHRDELDRVRTYPHTHYGKRWNNAAYYWLFGHYYASLAADRVGGNRMKEVKELILKAVILKREANGLWLDHEGFGIQIGTSHALMILGTIDGPFRLPEAASTTQGGGESEKN